jgi:XTP/dITP diphosphohydrolase
MKQELVVATRNKKKLQEIKDILKDRELAFKSLADYPRAPRIIENGRSFQENAVKKAVKIARFTRSLTLGEDSGLEVEALGGRPGIYSSRFAGKAKSDLKNNRKVLELLQGLTLAKRRARYRCAVALADKHGLVAVVEGSCSGRIAFAPRGSRGFGYDPLFIIPRYKKTFAELGEGIKHRMSHRYRALKKSKKILQKYIEKRGGN